MRHGAGERADPSQPVANEHGTIAAMAKRILVIGGGLAGLSTACYARANGWDVTVLEHGLALGGVCTAWRRDPYLVDGCIHWLTGGPFMNVYEELHVVPPVEVTTMQHFATVRDAHGAWRVDVTSNLEALGAQLRAIAPEDGEEIDRIVEAAGHIADLSPRIEHPAELDTLRDRLRTMWDARGELGTLIHFRGSVQEWTTARIRSPQLAAVLRRMFPAQAPMFFSLMVLGYLQRGWLSRPVGGTASFRDALVARFDELGAQARLGVTVDEVLVRDGRAYGVRLDDGTMEEGDIVVSTSSAPETILRLLGGRYGADALRDRLDRWKLFDPIAMVSWGVARSMSDLPQMLLVDGIDPVEIGGRAQTGLYLRIYNDDPAFAPPGHCVVQAMCPGDYDWWAKRGGDYHDTKAEVAARALEIVAPHVPGLTPDVIRMTDVATPLTYWRATRSWRGSFEGWMPASKDYATHVPKSLPGLEGFYMAGQWVEPGGGVPTALMSGRQLVQILCEAEGKRFASGA